MKPRCAITAAAWWPCLRHRVDWKPVSLERVKSGRVTPSIGLDRRPVRTSRWGGAVSHRAVRRSSMTLVRATRWPLPRMKDGINIHRPLSDIRCRCGWKKESLATWRDSASPLVRRNRPSCHGEIRSAMRNCALQPGSRAWQHCARSLRDHRSHSWKPAAMRSWPTTRRCGRWSITCAMAKVAATALVLRRCLPMRCPAGFRRESRHPTRFRTSARGA